jgi:hypothetical protein
MKHGKIGVGIIGVHLTRGWARTEPGPVAVTNAHHVYAPVSLST